jgi:hypothetical protein
MHDRQEGVVKRPSPGINMKLLSLNKDADHRLHHRPSTVRDILAHLVEPTAPPRIAPARGPPLREAVSAEHDPTPDPALPPIPAYEFDQRIAW